MEVFKKERQNVRKKQNKRNEEGGGKRKVVCVCVFNIEQELNGNVEEEWAND